MCEVCLGCIWAGRKADGNNMVRLRPVHTHIKHKHTHTHPYSTSIMHGIFMSILTPLKKLWLSTLCEEKHPKSAAEAERRRPRGLCQSHIYWKVNVKLTLKPSCLPPLSVASLSFFSSLSHTHARTPTHTHEERKEGASHYEKSQLEPLALLSSFSSLVFVSPTVIFWTSYREPLSLWHASFYPWISKSIF